MMQHQRKPIELPRFILFVDHQAKRGFDAREPAESEARRIRERYPHLQVRIEETRDVAKSA